MPPIGLAECGPPALSDGLAVCVGYGTRRPSRMQLRLSQQNCFHLALKRSIPVALEAFGRKLKPVIQPKTMLVANSLNDKRSAFARAAMKTLAPGERLIQLCNVEAMEQVTVWKPDMKPQQLVAYALGDPETGSSTVNAMGAAILAENQWFKLEYQCLADSSSSRVVSFAFRLGDVIPRDDLLAHHLALPGPGPDQ